MTETTVTGADVEDRTNKGLQNLWYPVLPSWRLKGDPLGITRLSQNIVLWRDPEGEVRVATGDQVEPEGRLHAGRMCGEPGRDVVGVDALHARVGCPRVAHGPLLDGGCATVAWGPHGGRN